jgi:hypothetical protein
MIQAGNNLQTKQSSALAQKDRIFDNSKKLHGGEFDVSFIKEA